jgi:hypothetical protein
VKVEHFQPLDSAKAHTSSTQAYWLCGALRLCCGRLGIKDRIIAKEK